MRSLSFVAVAVALVAACGNAPPAKNHPVLSCPESDPLPCMTAPTCEYDSGRRCEICRCTPPPYVPKERLDPITQQ